MQKSGIQAHFQSAPRKKEVASTRPEGFLRLSQILGDKRRGIPPLFPVSRTHWWEGIQRGIYPQGIRLSRRMTLWRASDIYELLDRISRGESD